ncbi:carbohydrate-binding protein [Actinoplanes sp. NPDC049265]|uniref:carbohydrate-binding protein n=1 Tax=Actinoplanes sp. NPDC049265 TaxID=3363902 RepID=UPI003718A1D4
MRRTLTSVIVALTLGLASSAGPASAAPAPAVAGTYSDSSGHHWTTAPRASNGPAGTTVVIDPSRASQAYTGMGFSLDETSVSNLWKLAPAERNRAIRLLADPASGAGFDRFRLTIGSPDLIEHLPFWSYDELPAGVTSDFGLKYFSIKRDIDLKIVATVKAIQRVNPDATFFASAWSAPAWMKTNNRFTGEVALVPGSDTAHYQVGKLRDDCIDVFARYYVEYLRAYAAQGIHIDTLTLLNEPGMDVVYPAMDISWEQQQKLALAVRRSVAAAGLDTGLYVHDFNFWDWRDPNSTETKNYHRIFNDPRVRRAADGIAFHPYWGDPAVMRDARREFKMPVHMTETSDLSPATVSSYFRLDASSYILWAQTTDQDGGTLHWTDKRDNDVDWDEVGRTTKWPDRMVKVNTETKTFTVRDELYQLGQFARYLTPRHVRVASSAPAAGVSNVVFRDGNQFVAVLGNSNSTATPVRLTLAGRSFTVTVPAGAWATYRWRASVPAASGPLSFAAVPPVTADQWSTVTIPLHTNRPASFYGADLPGDVTIDGSTLTVRPTTPGVREFTVTATDGVRSKDVTVRLTVNPAGAPAGAVVEAEAYTAQHGWTEGGANFIESTASASGGRNVGWTAPGNWLSYRVNLATAGTYDLELRVANGSGAAAPDAIRFGDAVVSVPDTGGWAAYRSVHVPVTLPAGDQLVTVLCQTGGFNLDYLRLTL